MRRIFQAQCMHRKNKNFSAYFYALEEKNPTANSSILCGGGGGGGGGAIMREP